MQNPTNQLAEDITIWDTIYQVLIFGILIFVPVILLVLLFATDLYVNLGGAIGLNIKRDPGLIIYDAVCEGDNTLQQLNMTFYAQDSAPIVVKFAGYESRPVNFDAGVNTLHVNIREQEKCPSIITLKDTSRARESSHPVEVFTP